MSSADTPAASTAHWQARPVFISSTFADMQAERDYLRDHVFYCLEEKLRERRHRFEPIALRLGVENRLAGERASARTQGAQGLPGGDRAQPALPDGAAGRRYGTVPAAERISATWSLKGTPWRSTSFLDCATSA